MIRVLALAVLLAGCAAKEPAKPVYLPDAPQTVTPVTLAELRGEDALIFPDISPAETAERLEAHLRRCRAADGSVRRDAHGYSVLSVSGEPRLVLMLAQVSQSSAVAVGGPDFSPVVKEELAEAVQGRSVCA